ncbi:unnamed protein product [Effrenium voratum]|nr:unnamed protein product [Effrenium voratum]
MGVRWLALRRQCLWGLGALPVVLLTAAILILPMVMPHVIFQQTNHQKATRYYFENRWLSKQDTAVISSRGCDILFYKDLQCSCADEIIAGIMARGVDGKTIYSDANWRLIQDPKMTAGSLHYTAWSSQRDLRTAAELRRRHAPLLRGLLREGARAVMERHPELRSPEDLAVFLHFPPNIFRLHIHFVVNRTMLQHEDVVPLRALIPSLEAAQHEQQASPLLKRFWTVEGSHILTCSSWQ